MSNNKHTPGDWYVASTGNHQGLVASESTGDNIAIAYDKQDAPLLAAAPDLLDALRMISATTGDQAPLLEICERVDELARAAIAKARGEDV